MLSKTALSFIAICALLSSCVVEQNYYFNKDLSGTYNLMVDVSSMEEFASSDSLPTDSTFTSEDIRSFKEEYSKKEGISNVEAGFEEGVLTAMFHFTGLEALEKANTPNPINAEEGENLGMMNVFDFTPTKSGMEIDVLRDFMGDESQSEEEPTTPEDIEAMDAMLSLSGNFTFERPIASFESEVGSFDAESNTVSIYVSFADIYNKEKNLKSVIVFK
jgi:hypothetical protein